jgi:uncharacterized protein with von Willebrand factor type A (vWA) domain
VSALRYGWLDALPVTLRRAVVTNLHGELHTRASAVIALRDALVRGELPARESVDWPEPSLAGPLFDALAESGVVVYCRDHPELAEAVVLSVLDLAQELHRRVGVLRAAFFEMASAERAARGVSSVPPTRCATPGDAVSGRAIDLDASLRSDAERLLAETTREFLRGRVQASWAWRVEHWAEISAVLEGLREALGLRYGLAAGVLRAIPWWDSMRLRAALTHVSELTEILRQLGRIGLDLSADEDLVVAQRTDELAPSLVRLPSRGSTKDEVRGVVRSGDLRAMLPAEAAALAHPRLKGLWYARFAERSLMAWHAEGVEPDAPPTERGPVAIEPTDGAHTAPLARGPVLVVIDTSESMSGVRDKVARAVALQVACVAFHERRPCRLVMFSGADELREHTLSFEGDGIYDLLKFLAMGFFGGTEINQVLRDLTRRWPTPEWRRADLVLVSDGAFAPDPDALEAFHRARLAARARAHGVHVGAEPETHAPMAAICDPVHDVAPWLASLRPAG